MDKKLYRVVVNKTAHYFVLCHPAEMGAWLKFLGGEGHSDNIVTTEINLSDFDEINHLYFC